MEQQKKYDLSQDERAIIYNHVTEIQQEAPGCGPITIVVQRSPEGNFHCSLSTHDSTPVETEGHGPTVYEASSRAKQQLILRLRRLLNSSQSSTERSIQILSILYGSTLH